MNLIVYDSDRHLKVWPQALYGYKPISVHLEDIIEINIVRAIIENYSII